MNKKNSSDYVTKEFPQKGVQQRRSTAFSCSDRANITDRVIIDISLDQSRESIVALSLPESESHHSSTVSPALTPVVPRQITQFSPAHIGLELENISDSDDNSSEELNVPKENVDPPSRSLVNSPADLYTLVPRVKRTIERTSHSSSNESEVDPRRDFGERSEENDSGTSDSSISDDEASCTASEVGEIRIESQDVEDGMASDDLHAFRNQMLDSTFKNKCATRSKIKS